MEMKKKEKKKPKVTARQVFKGFTVPESRGSKRA